MLPLYLSGATPKYTLGVLVFWLLDIVAETSFAEWAGPLFTIGNSECC